jgi:carnosine N-methyltransferase
MVEKEGACCHGGGQGAAAHVKELEEEHGHGNTLAHAHEHAHEHGHEHERGQGAGRDANEQRHLDEVLNSMSEYALDMAMEAGRRERNLLLKPSLAALMPGGAEGIAARTETLRACFQANQRFLDEVLMCSSLAQASYDSDPEASDDDASAPRYMRIEPDLDTAARNLGKVRSTLHQCAREWSSEGAAEREACFTPLLDALERHCARGGRVLCPGSGLGRLPAEVVGRGFSCQGNEFSYHMLVVSEFILNTLTGSDAAEQRAIFPWIHNTSNVARHEDLVREVRIPDVAATELVRRIEMQQQLQEEMQQVQEQQQQQQQQQPQPPPVEMSMCAGEFIEIYKGQHCEWDAVLTCFFIDTAHNVLEYLRVIYDALKPGGVWVNAGPLLWHWQNCGPKGGVTGEDRRYSESVEISWDQLKHVAERLGFHFLEERWAEVGYTNNPSSMMKTVYTIVHTVARKPLA